MKAEIYSIKICDNAIDKVHGFFREIVELYIPDKKIVFNEDSDLFHCFISGKERYEKATKIGEIIVPKAMLQAMTDYINISKRLCKTKKWFKRCVMKGNFNWQVKERKSKKGK